MDTSVKSSLNCYRRITMNDATSAALRGSRISRRRMISYCMISLAGIVGGFLPGLAFGNADLTQGRPVPEYDRTQLQRDVAKLMKLKRSLFGDNPSWPDDLPDVDAERQAYWMTSRSSHRIIGPFNLS
jgi:hypothetical protein